MGPPLHPIMKLRLNRKSRPPQTELQKLAQKENYALFQLKSMESQLHHLRQLNDSVINGRISNIEFNIAGITDRIKGVQAYRKQQREKSNG